MLAPAIGWYTYSFHDIFHLQYCLTSYNPHFFFLLCIIFVLLPSYMIVYIIKLWLLYA